MIRRLYCIDLSAVLVVLGWALFHGPVAAAAANPINNNSKNNKKKLPNIILLLTDDQDVVVGGMAHMPKLQALLQENGVTFDNGFVHTPICCPSRSSIVSGRYLHNGGALNNTVQGNCNGEYWQEDAEKTSFATALKKMGYKTSFAGKYLNMYGIRGSPGCSEDANGTRSDGCRRVPPGWDRWLGLIGNSQYYNYGVIKSMDGGKTPAEEIRHGDHYGKDYFPDLVANWTLDSIHEFSSDSNDEGQPFLAVAAWPTAHMPFTPAPWAETKFDGAKAMQTPNYNASAESLSTKHWMMRGLAPIDPATEAWMNSVYQNRTEALLSVDNHIELFIQALRERGVYDNTWIIYTSDNGWQLGQHRLSYDKRQLYENDIRVPFIVTGPGVPSNVTSQAIVLNVDIAPTMVDMAKSALLENEDTNDNHLSVLKQLQDTLDTMDGTSFLPAIFGKSNDKEDQSTAREKDPSSQNDLRKDFLVSYHGRGTAQCGNFWDCPAAKPFSPDYHMGDWTNNTYHCVRTMSTDENSIYCRFLDDERFVEYYDIATDPWQLQNEYTSLSVDQRIRYERRLEELRICQGKTCRLPPNQDILSDESTASLEVEVQIS